MKINYLFSALFAAGLFILVPNLVEAQGPTGIPSATSAPLDGGLSVLLAAGAAVGIKKAYQKRSKDKSLR